MKFLSRFRMLSFLLVAAGGALAMPAGAQPPPAPAATSAGHDGQHDFDFNVGVWKTQIRRIQDPLSGATHTLDISGTVTVHTIWGGRALWEEIETDGPNGHWQGMTLFLYDPKAHQWRQSFINSAIGELVPPLIGSFHDGRGELFAQDTFDGRSILVRGVWSDIKPDSHRFEESYSADGGRTWAPAFIANLTRVKS